MPPKILAQYAQRATRITAAWLLRTSRGRARARQSSRASHLHACEGWGERAARREKGETTTWTTVAWLLLSGQPEPYDRFRVSSEETCRRKGEQTEPGYCLRIVHFR